MEDIKVKPRRLLIANDLNSWVSRHPKVVRGSVLSFSCREKDNSYRREAAPGEWLYATTESFRTYEYRAGGVTRIRVKVTVRIRRTRYIVDRTERFVRRYIPFLLIPGTDIRMRSTELESHPGYHSGMWDWDIREGWTDIVYGGADLERVSGFCKEKNHEAHNARRARHTTVPHLEEREDDPAKRPGARKKEKKEWMKS